MKKLFAIFVLSVMFASVFMTASASAIKIGRMDWQIRSNMRNFKDGIMNPYFPPVQGTNHWGTQSDYSPRMSQSELCEEDSDVKQGLQLRPFNQGLNIPTFYSCN